MLPHSLDPLADETFVPYRDSSGCVRLLDVHLPRVSKPAAVLYRRMARVLATGRRVDSEAAYRAWMDQHWAPLSYAITEAKLGCCIGDEGRTLHDLSDAVIDAVHQPGWRYEDRAPEGTVGQ